MFESPFGTKEDLLIPSECDIVFVSDLFASQYLGGAELTTQALMDSVPEGIKSYCINAKDVTIKTLESGMNKFWIFGNAVQMNLQLIPSIVANLNYSILEYDYKFCRYRSIEKHFDAEQKECDCEHEMTGKLYSAFFHGAKTVFYMSQEQMEIYHKRFPFLSEQEGSNQFVLSSVFDDKFFAQIKLLKDTPKNNKWLVVGGSWIKGTDDGVKWCEDNEKEYEVLQGLRPGQVLQKMAESEGLVFLPKGKDTCPRVVLEAQLLGCKLHLNDNVQHKDEFPFSGGTQEDIEIYLYGRRDAFWEQTKLDMSWNPRISGYTTTYNCISQKYPFKQSIKSLLGFCDEVVVMDGGSNDGTYQELVEWSENEPKLKVYINPIDWNAKGSAVEDGKQKARARDKCTMEFCWQQDVDEIVHETHYEKITKLCRQFPKFIDLISLPVVEFWGGYEKVRLDINPWKWRLSRNKPEITHGIPKHLQMFHEDGTPYAKMGTDGCDYIHKETHELIAHASFYTQQIHDVRMAALHRIPEAMASYQGWFDNLVKNMPGVFHYSWFDIERKIKTYSKFWQKHWESLFDIKQEDTAENNMFFDKPWSEVTDNEITELAKKLASEMGGWVFHSKVDFTKPTPHLTLNMNPPEVMNEQ